MAKQRKPRPSKSTRAFYPPRIAAATENVISEKVPKPPEVPVQGIPLSLFKRVTNRQGVLAGAVTLRIDSIPADADHPNDIDEVSWWLNGNRMEGVAINPANRDDVWFFNVFLDDLLDTVTNEILYKTRRPGGNETPSTALWVLCSKTLPGGNDVPGTGAHPGLQLSLPTELGNPALIGKDEVEAGVLATYTYSHMKAYDTITLDINGEQFTVKLDPDDVGASFSALIDRTMFEWVGSLDNCPFRYRVRDQLGNFTHNHRWSGIIYANIDLERVFFPKPVLRERADDTTDDPETVKLDLLEGKPLLVMIRADDSLYKIGDIVTAYYWLDDSTEKASEPGEFPADEFGDLDKCIVYIPNDQLVSGARLQVRFEVERPKGTVIGTSRIAAAKIIGEAAPDFVAPLIKEAPGETLNPLAAEYSLTAVIRADLRLINTDVVVKWIGTAGAGSHTTASVRLTTAGPHEISIPNTVVAFNLGNSVVVSYDVITSAGCKGSLQLPLSVQAIADGDPAMGRPFIVEAANGGEGSELDVGQLTEDATIRVNSYPLIAENQYVWLRLSGTNNNGTEYHETFWQPPNDKTNVQWITQGFWTHSAPLINLRNLQDLSYLRVDFIAGLNGSQVEAEGLHFHHKTYKLLMNYPEGEDFETWPLSSITMPDQILYGPTMDVRMVTGPGRISIKKSDYGVGLKSLFLHANSGTNMIAELTFKHPFRSISFLAGEVQFSGQYAHAYNQQGDLINKIELINGRMTFPKTSQIISKIEIHITRTEGMPLDEFILIT